MVYGAEAIASGGIACSCATLTPERRDALRSDQHDLAWRRAQREWRPGR
jgi:hypothetical protein